MTPHPSTPRGPDGATSATRTSLLIPLIVAVALFMEMLDATIIVTALPRMAGSLGVDVARMSVGITAYLMAVAACVTASGWLADRIGSRTLFCAAIGMFTIASVICGMAQSFPMFVAGRVLQGASAAMMSPVGRLVVLRTTPKSGLGRALSALIWPGLVAPVIGPPLGGLITDVAGWRWIFFVNVPIGLAGMALVMAFVPDARQQPRPFDRAGFVLMGLALVALTCGLDLLGLRNNSSLAWGAGLVAAAFLLGIAVNRHLRRTPHPLVDLSILKVDSFFVSSFSGGATARAAVSTAPFLLPLMFQLVYGMTPLQSGSLLLTYMLANLLMKPLTGPILARVGVRNALVWSSLAAGAGIALCAFVSPRSDLLVNSTILAFAGASRSMLLTSITLANFADIAPSQRQPASVLSSLSQQISMGAGVALGALLLVLGQASRGGTALTLPDFRIALLLAGVMGAIAAWSFRGLAHSVGDEISGRTEAPRTQG